MPSLFSERQVAEDATGVRQHGRHLGRFYLPGGLGLAPVDAMLHLFRGRRVEVPNAGAGSYREFFTSVGFKAVETIDQTSSAGDWTFAVQASEGWLFAGQENRHPYHGFTYWVDASQGPFASVEDLLNCCTP